MLILASILVIKAMGLVCMFIFMPLVEKEKTFVVSQCDVVVNQPSPYQDSLFS